MEDPGPPPVAHQLDLAKLSPDARARVIRAATTDLDAASWIGHQLQWNHAACMTFTSAADGTQTIAGQNCNGFSGSLEIVDQKTYRFHHVQLADQDIELDGTLVENFDLASFIKSIDMTITRSGVAVHSTYATDTNGPQAGATIELAGDRAELALAPGAVTFTTFDPAIAPVTFTYEHACGADPVNGDPICLWNTEPTTFTTGTFRKLERVCEGNDARLQFTSASDRTLMASIGGVHYSIGGGVRDAATNLYTFSTSDGACDHERSFDSYQVSQPPAYRAELLIAPHLVWSLE